MNLLMHYETVSMVLISITGGLASAGMYKLLYPGKGFVYRKGEEFAGMIRARRSGSAYERVEAWLKKNGASYHIGKRIDPGRLAGICIVMGCAGFLVGMSISVFAGIVLGALLAVAVPLIIPALNRSDSKAMLSDIRLIYHSLGVQIKSGVYVTDALAECSTSVRNKRLKDALSEFYADVIMKSDIY